RRQRRPRPDSSTSCALVLLITVLRWTEKPLAWCCLEVSVAAFITSYDESAGEYGSTTGQAVTRSGFFGGWWLLCGGTGRTACRFYEPEVFFPSFSPSRVE